jgi:hypothetical protein
VTRLFTIVWQHDRGKKNLLAAVSDIDDDPNASSPAAPPFL